jgi:hypothetical protein
VGLEAKKGPVGYWPGYTPLGSIGGSRCDNKAARVERIIRKRTIITEQNSGNKRACGSFWRGTSSLVYLDLLPHSIRGCGVTTYPSAAAVAKRKPS